MSVAVYNDVSIEWQPSPGAVHYKFNILNDASAIVRTGTVASTELTYTKTQATADGGPWPSLTIQIKAVDGAGNESPAWQSVTVNNPFQTNQAAAQTDLTAHLADTTNPHNVTLTQLGAGTIATENAGASGTFTTADGKTVTVLNGVVTAIV